MTPDLRRSLSLVVPVFNEETSIAPFLDRVLPILRRLEGQFGFEILFVNDGSFDGTERAIDEFARRVPEIGLLSLSRNFGKEAALFAGLRHARGDAVIPLDVDLQDPPTIVLEMVERWSKGAKIVNARRGNRDGDGWLKRVTASLFYRIFNTLADRPIPQSVGDFRLLDRDVVDAVCALGERCRFNKALVAWVGFEPEEIVLDRPARSADETH